MLLEQVAEAKDRALVGDAAVPAQTGELTEKRNVVKRFYRLDSSRGSEGAGLGLSLVEAITNAPVSKIPYTTRSIQYT